MQDYLTYVFVNTVPPSRDAKGLYEKSEWQQSKKKV